MARTKTPTAAEEMQQSTAEIIRLPYDTIMKFAEIGIETVEALPDVRNPAAFMKIQDRATRRMMEESVQATRSMIGLQMQLAAATFAVFAGPRLF